LSREAVLIKQNTIGGFIAALRKSRGMTQQEVADRLNVSNKTISKWERDEGYPEITIIPALAELFGVTSDEILRGERIPPSDQETEKHSARVEQQVRRIVNSSITRFINYSYLAAALSLTGLLCLFTTAYAFFRPVLGFGIMFIFVIASITIELFMLNTCRAATREHEITGDNREMLVPLWKTVNRYAFALFMINIAVVILSLPIILIRDSHYVESVITMESYLELLPTLVLIIALLCAFMLSIFKEKLFLSEEASSGKTYSVKKMRRMNFVQGAALAAALIIPLCGALYLNENNFLRYACLTGFFALLGLAILSMILPVAKSKDIYERCILVAAGIRNLLYGFALLYALSGLTIIYPAHGERQILYRLEPVALWILLDATVLYLLARYFILKGYRRNREREQKER
jgi:transcriptional regulator with XRE-family HTH domain